MLTHDGESLHPYMDHHMDQPEADWRRLNADDRLEYAQWIVNLVVSRQAAGRKTYGDTFVGDPLQHLSEELIDALFYCFQAQRQRAASNEKANS